ncbi:MAG: hypothetical protein ACYDAY_10955 [Candidatus Dormibacteria bacterium]
MSDQSRALAAALCEKHLYLVTAEIERCGGRGAGIDGLYEEGVIALMQASVERVATLIPGAGEDADDAEFVEFAAAAIAHAIEAVVARESDLRAAESQLLADVRAFDRVEGRLRVRLARVPGDRDLAEALEWELERVKHIRRLRDEALTAAEVTPAAAEEDLDIAVAKLLDIEARRLKGDLN